MNHPLSKFSTALITTVLSMTLPILSVHAEDSAVDYVHLIDKLDPETTDCAKSGGKRIYVVNKHKTDTIDVRVDRFFQDVRQAGRSVIVLRAGEEQALGCSIALDAKQFWKIVSSEFVEEEDH